MNYKDGIEPVTVLKTKSAELIRRTRETGQPVVITQNGKATAILLDIEAYERQRKALLLLKFLAKGDSQLREGLVVSHDEAKAQFEKTLKRLKAQG